jgi:predicted RNA-binding Zn-ribbon protein involved in translation (DUF1610 family)
MKPVITYHLCPHCFRAVPQTAAEYHCPNDGSLLLTACPECSAPIASPYARYCTTCGQSFALAAPLEKVSHQGGKHE